jgi:hypothetical protein
MVGLADPLTRRIVPVVLHGGLGQPVQPASPLPGRVR